MYRQLAESFFNSGGRRAFGITGSGPSLSLIDQLEKVGVEFVTTGHESTAALMAGAYARLSDSPALAMSIKGPGFMNMLPGLLCNAYEGLPSISVSESYAKGYMEARCHKWLDHQRAGGEFLKRHMFFQPGCVTMDDCWETARRESPGPVHVDLGAGENPETITDGVDPTSDFAALAERVGKSRRPLLIVGSLGLRSGWRSSLQRLELPVFTTAAGKGLIDESSPLAAGVFTGAGKPETPEKQLLPKADLIVTLGVRAAELLNPAFDPDLSLHLDSVSARSGHFFPPHTTGGQIHIVSDDQILDLLGLLQEKHWGMESVGSSHARLGAVAADYGWSPVAAMRTVQSRLPEAAHILDTGNFTVLGEHFLQARGPTSLLGTPNGRYMGAALGYALGASLALPGRPVVLWIGDGGIRSLFAELALAAENNLRLLVLVIKDGSFGSIRGSAVNSGLTQKPVMLSERSLAGIGRAMGLHTGTIDSEDQLSRVIDTWGKEPVPSLYECPFDPDRYIELTARLR